MLHDDIRVLGVQPAALDFDARKSAIGKQYRYFLWDGPVMPPCRRFYRFHTARPMDLAGMQEAAGRLQGRHDFAAFSANPNREVPSTIRTLRRLEVKRHGYAMTIIAESEGFLYKMVRSLAGFLIRVGEGALSPDDGEEILRSRLRTARVPTAPPQGLFLWDVRY
jgi:tRNA pseudouridine38-40 synthase